MKINPQDHPDYVGGWIWTELEIRWIEELINKVAATEQQKMMERIRHIIVQAEERGAAAEREACAELAESFDVCDPKHIAAAIRARGEK